MTTDTNAPAKGIASATVLTFMFCLIGYFACNCGTGCKSINIGKLFQTVTNAIPQVTTTTQPAVIAPVTPTSPQVSTNRPLPYASTLGYYNHANGNPSFSFAKWSSGKAGDTCDSKNGQEIPSSAVWSIVGTNYPCAVDGGIWYAAGVNAAGLWNPIALTITAKSGVYVYTVPQPSIGGKSIKAVKQ